MQSNQFRGGRQGGGSPGERLQEVGEERAGGGSLQGWEAGDQIDKRLKKNIINNNFNIIILFNLYIASKYTTDTNVLPKIHLKIYSP